MHFQEILKMIEERCLETERANNDLYIKATQMFAETPIMQIEINQPKDLNEDTNLDAKR